uniref:Uncharacterized protein n=1 Tax=Ascaris lumbricoides TaxID=6252 RepID=A0A9J2PPK1_ASCLU
MIGLGFALILRTGICDRFQQGETIMPDYIKQVTVTGDVSTIVDDENLLQDWCAEVAKEVWEQKPEFAVIHIQGLRAAENPDKLADKIVKWYGLGSIYLFRSYEEIELFDRYSNTGYKSLRPGHQYEIGARECDGFIASTFGSASSSHGSNSLRYEADYYVSLCCSTF